ncbi:hypothetical protein LEP1GSC111_0841 [Leptospira interrogans str. UT126]|nr:hypothetical protein LEP1GSC111_0841 [Leptospira interrogans str. UT126]
MVEHQGEGTRQNRKQNRNGLCELAETVKEVEGFRYFDFRSDEIPCKLLDVSKLHRMGWKYQVK